MNKSLHVNGPEGVGGEGGGRTKHTQMKVKSYWITCQNVYVLGMHNVWYKH